MDNSAGFGLLVNALGGGGDRGNMFPASDADDLSKGARFIPGEVTLARRAGQTVNFINTCRSSCCWYWELQDGTRIYHWDPLIYAEIGRHNNGTDWTRESKQPAGKCHLCGNENTSGGTITPS